MDIGVYGFYEIADVRTNFRPECSHARNHGLAGAREGRGATSQGKCTPGTMVVSSRWCVVEQLLRQTAVDIPWYSEKNPCLEVSRLHVPLSLFTVFSLVCNNLILVLRSIGIQPLLQVRDPAPDQSSTKKLPSILHTDGEPVIPCQRALSVGSLQYPSRKAGCIG